MVTLTFLVLLQKPTSQTKPEENHKVTKENTAVVTNADGKSPKVILSKHKGKVKKRKTKMKKETIDYSSMQKHPSSPTKDTEALTKVQKWLLSSPQPTVIPKSKSIPVGLTERAHRQVQKGARKTRPSKSATNLLTGEKARLQVVFKPPFRFSVKICKSDKTKVVLDKSSKPDVDRKRHEAAPPTAGVDHAKPNPSSNKPKHSNSTRLEDVTPGAPRPDPPAQESADHGYANLLPRSASDCKLAKKLPEVKIRNGHRKSNSVGQRRETTESRQNLIAPEDADTAHVYENVLVSHEAFVPKSCNMPRRQPAAVTRQASSGHLPRAHARPHRHSSANVARDRHNSTGELDHFYSVIESLRRPAAAPCDTNTSSSSGSSRDAGRSGSRPGRASRQNSLVDEPTRASPVEGDSRLRRQLSEAALGRRPASDVRGFQLVVGKSKLKRQLSDNELCRSRVQLAMPMSAGAEPRQAFCWAGAAPAAKKRSVYTFGELKNTVPNATEPTADDVQISPEEFLNIIDD